nr:hypothetical protein [Natranaerobius trueperi]
MFIEHRLRKALTELDNLEEKWESKYELEKLENCENDCRYH